MAGLVNRSKLDELMQEVSGVLEPHGFVCIEVEWQGHDRILRLYVDVEGSDTGVDLDGCVRVSRILDESGRLDERVSGAYTLEVSSPGIERPLRRAQDFQRFVGNEIEARLSVKHQERRRARGFLKTVEAHGTDTLITLDTPEGAWTFPLASLAKANLIHDWGES